MAGDVLLPPNKHSFRRHLLETNLAEEAQESRDSQVSLSILSVNDAMCRSEYGLGVGVFHFHIHNMFILTHCRKTLEIESPPTWPAKIKVFWT